ncbi:MAG: dethiobiotin synthase [Rhodocyclales bacterium RIFCSPLOWO2_02_FULL_63_24]|nr:MAG: dethiobiotin synthase [Rhodocyclales bacterium RIFCSPLOWO2_02_FULL_63_24]
MDAHFITGTGTDIGKTWLACALLRHWRDAGMRPAAFKPVLSGFDPQRPEASDAGALLAALGRAASVGELDAIAPWRFAAPLSPDMAAAREGRTIDFAELVAYTRRCLPPRGNPRHAERASAVCADNSGPILVEGVGGVMAPLDESHTVRDWIAASGLHCVLMAGSYLGSLSHTLTALEALARVGAGVTAVVVNETPDSTVALDATLEALSRHAVGIPLVSIARDTPQPGVVRLAALLCPEIV